MSMRTTPLWIALMVATTAVTAAQETIEAERQWTPKGAAQSTVFRYWGELSQGPPHSVDGTTFKEVELAFLDDVQASQPWLDIYLPQKHPRAGSGNNMDLIYRNRGDISLSWHRGAAAFELRTTALSFANNFQTTRSYDVEFADLDGDEDLDLIRPDWRSALHVGWNDGNARFTVETLLGASSANPVFSDPNGFVPANGYDDIAVVDLNNDGNKDFVAAYYPSDGSGTGPSPVNVIFENLTCKPAPGQPCGVAINELRIVGSGELPADGTHSISFADINGDKFEDALLADATTTSDPSFPLHLGADFVFSDQPQLLEPPPLDMMFEYLKASPIVDFADLDRDGHPDIYIAKSEDQGSDADHRVWLRHGVYFHSCHAADPYPSMTEGPPMQPLEAQIYDARYADLDDDGNMEIVVVTINAGDSPGSLFPTELFVFQVDSTTRAITDVSSSMLPANGLLGGIGVALGDLDNDQDLDMVLAGAVANKGTIGHIAAAQIYENLTHIFLRNANIDENRDFIAHKTLVAGEQLTVDSGVTALFEARDEIRLIDGFTATAGSEMVMRLSN